MAQLNDYIGYTGINYGKPARPTDPYDQNGIALITPQNERGDVKKAYAVWLQNWRDNGFTVPFDYPGLDYSDE
jgi:hypothetical protein